jgi:hypothetical protein
MSDNVQQVNHPSAENVERANKVVAHCIESKDELVQTIIAQALDEAERRGAVKELRKWASEPANYYEAKLVRNAVEQRANELESATKAPEEG